jgi:hypothetical protein
MEIRYNDWQSNYSGVSVNDIQVFLKRTLTDSEKDFVNALLPLLESYICLNTDRQFKVLNDGDYYYEEYKFEKVHFLYNYPVKEIYKILVDDEVVYLKGASNNDFEIGLDFDYDEYQLMIYRDLTGSKIKVLYTINKFYGNDVKLAIIEAVIDYLNTSDYGMKKVNNLSIGGLSVSLSERGVLDKVIENYKKVNL